MRVVRQVLRKAMPWWAIFAAKLALSSILNTYESRKRFSLFRHGDMDSPAYALQVFRRHFNRTQFDRKHGGFTMLELGPGDSLFSAVIARSFGASTVYLVDGGPFATADFSAYARMLEHLRSEGLPVSDRSMTSTDELLAECNAIYLTSGLSSLREIPDKSVDFIYSNAVFEHIRREEFKPTMAELRRIVRDNGIGSHCIDLRDHIDGALNNLRFSEHFWEGDRMQRIGCYTNRIRYSEMLDILSEVGFDVEVVSKEQWQRLPTKKSKMQPEFRKMNDEDLSVAVFDVELRLR